MKRSELKELIREIVIEPEMDPARARRAVELYLKSPEAKAAIGGIVNFVASTYKESIGYILADIASSEKAMEILGTKDSKQLLVYISDYLANYLAVQQDHLSDLSIEELAKDIREHVDMIDSLGG